MEFTIQVPEGADRVAMLGTADTNLKILREAFGVNIAARNGTVRLSGDGRAVSAARRVLERLGDAARRSEPMGRRAMLNAVADAADFLERHGEVCGAAADGPGAECAAGEASGWDGDLDVYVRGRRVQPRSDNQRAYLRAIHEHDLVFGVGPAGTGKTYLAVAAAAHMLKAGLVRKMILVRPAVEAGEKLGFLPGDMEAKVNPYLRPLLDALHDMMDFGAIKRFMLSDVVEIAPLAFMRGRTLNDAAIILDEAQNTTKGQMQMFLTRLGERSKMVVTGDTTQIDLPDPRQSGLVDAARRLGRVPGVAFVGLGKADIVRHSLVQRVVDAYALGSPETPSPDAAGGPEAGA